MQRLTYLTHAILGRFSESRCRCPYCGAADFESIQSKYWVTQLVRCKLCQLRYRIPQDHQSHYFEFYQNDYSSTVTTECPAPDELSSLMSKSFVGTGKNFAHRIEILRALGICTRDRILDYGASWGYGTWQFRQAGLDAYGYDISRPRAKYARDYLAVSVVEDIDQIEGKFDFIFSSHVLEHLPTPAVAFDLARARLKPGGIFVAFTPNGSEACRTADPAKYHDSWGRLHPLYLDEAFYEQSFPSLPKLLCSANYGQKYDLASIAAWDRTTSLRLDLSRPELLAVIRFC